MRWCDRNGVYYILGVAKNQVLLKNAQPWTFPAQWHCQRGDMENRIKEQQLYLFADRTSCQDFLTNQFRLLLSSAAYILVETLRREGLSNTKMKKAQAHTIRNKLLKVAAVIQVSTRRIVFHLASGYPYKELFAKLLCRLTRRSNPTLGFT